MEISGKDQRKLSSANKTSMMDPSKKWVWMGSTRTWQIIWGLKKTISSIGDRVSVLTRRVYVEEAGDKQLIQNICASLALRSPEIYDTACVTGEKNFFSFPQFFVHDGDYPQTYPTQLFRLQKK